MAENTDITAEALHKIAEIMTIDTTDPECNVDRKDLIAIGKMLLTKYFGVTISMGHLDIIILFFPLKKSHIYFFNVSLFGKELDMRGSQ